MTDALFPLPLVYEPDWKYTICPVCGKGFTAKSWDDRHTWLVDGESDVHAGCCRCNGRHDNAQERTP